MPIHRNAKILLRINIMKDRSTPYETQLLKIVNKHFRAKVPVLGNCNWGTQEFLCYGRQLNNFLHDLSKVNPGSSENRMEITVMDTWPAYPINATGDESIIGVDSETSQPLDMIALHKRINKLENTLRQFQKTAARMLEKHDDAMELS